jgi:Domain of unknown function (DUF4340)
MSTRRFVWLFIAALLVICGAMYLSNQRYLERDPRGGELIANLNSRLDAITRIQIRKDSAQPTLTLDRGKPGQWSIAQRDAYPADAAKVRHLLLALADAKIVEEKTSTPANYAAIGVEDPAPASAASPAAASAPAAGADSAAPAAGGSVEVTLLAPSAKSTVIVGHSSGSGTFARRGGEAKSYVVEPAVTVEATPRDWIDGKLLDIPPEKIRAVDVKPVDGAAYTISRQTAKQPVDPKDKSNAEPKDTDFGLDKTPPGRQPAEPASIGPSATTFSGVTADDVAAAKDIDFARHSSVLVSLFDGGSYSITGAVAGDKHWITIDAPATDAVLSARAKGRAFEVASYRYDALFRALEQLLKPKPEKPKPGDSHAKPAPKP